MGPLDWLFFFFLGFLAGMEIRDRLFHMNLKSKEKTGIKRFEMYGDLYEFKKSEPN